MITQLGSQREMEGRKEKGREGKCGGEKGDVNHAHTGS
jgi:hypothetical protein